MRHILFQRISILLLFSSVALHPIQAQTLMLEKEDVRWVTNAHFGLGLRMGGDYDDQPEALRPSLSRSDKGIYGELSIEYNPKELFIPFGITAKGFHSSVDSPEARFSRNIFFVGPFFQVFCMEASRHLIRFRFGPGCLFYRSNGFAQEERTVSGTALGINANFAYSYFLTESLALGLSLSATTGELDKAKYVTPSREPEILEFNEDERFKLTHLGISAGAFWYF